jgi:hypothetical protein
VKFAFIQWVGESVKPMAKAKLSTFKGSLEDLFKVGGPAIVASLSMMKFEPHSEGPRVV